MKKILLVLATLGLVSCVHQETQKVDAEVRPSRITFSAKDLFKFTSQDISKLMEATSPGSKSKKLELSEKRTAQCAEQKCKITVLPNYKPLPLGRKEALRFKRLHDQALKAHQELKEVDGVAILRCSPPGCAVDIYAVDENPDPIKVKATLTDETDFAAVILQALVSGALQGALK